MNNTTTYLESTIQTAASDILSVYLTAADIYKIYFSTNASTLIGGVPAGGDAVTVASKLTKNKFVNGITMCEQIKNFVENAEVTQGDYLASAQNLINGSDQRNAALSQDVESLGTRMQSLGSTLVALNQTISSALKVYSSAQMSGILTAISGDPVILGCSTTKSKMLDGINLIQQISNFMGNQSVTQGDYQTLIQKWIQGI